MRAVNLLPDQGQDSGVFSRVSTNQVGVVGASVFAVCAIVMGGLFFQSHSKVSDKEGKLAKIEQHTDKLRSTVAKSAASQSNEESRVNAFTSAASARIAWDDLLDDVSRVLPSGSWLSSLEMSVGSGTPAPTTSSSSTSGSTTTTTTPVVVPTAFSVTGYAFSQNEVAHVMQRLALVPALRAIALQSSSKTSVGETNAFQFTINGTVVAPEVDR